MRSRIKSSLSLFFLLLTFACAGGTARKGIQEVVTSENGGPDATPIYLSLFGPTNVTQGVCSGPFMLSTIDGDDHPVQMKFDLSIEFRSTSTQAFSDAACNQSLSSPRIMAGTATLSFYVKNTSVGTIALNALAAGFTEVSLQVVTVAPTETPPIDPTPPASTDLVVYKNGLLNSSFMNTSWDAVIDTQSLIQANTAIGSTRSLEATFSMYGGWQVQTDTPIQPSNYTALHFWLFIDDQTKTTHNVGIQAFEGEMLEQPKISMIVDTNRWIEILIPKGTLNPGNRPIAYFFIMGNEFGNKKYYLDDVTFQK